MAFSRHQEAESQCIAAHTILHIPLCGRRYADGRASEACHEFHNDLVLLGDLGDGVVAVEILLIVEPDVGDERFADAPRHAGREARAFVVVDYEAAVGVLAPVKIADAIAVIGHVIVADEGRDLCEEAPPERYVPAREDIERVDVVEGVVTIVLVEVLALDEQAPEAHIEPRVVHHHGADVRPDLLDAEHGVDIAGGHERELGGVVDALGPVVFLIGKAGAVEQSRLDLHGDAQGKGGAHHGAHVAHIAHLLGQEGAVGEVLLVGRAVGIDGERHAHLSDGQLERVDGQQADIGVEPLDLALVAQVYLGLVVHPLQRAAADAHAGVAHLEAALAFAGLVFIFAAYCAVDLGDVAAALRHGG